MGRAILAVILGYLTMFVVVFVTFTTAYLILKADGSFEEGTYDVSTAWIAVSFVVGFVAAVGGGFVCSLVAPRPGPLRALIVVVVLLGLASAFAAMGAEDPGPRTGDVGNIEAMTNAVQPTWMAFANIVVGVAGILVGGRRALGATKAG